MNKSEEKKLSQQQISMNPMMLFFTQLLPLVVFIVVDAFVADVRISILCAVIFAVGQLLLTYVKSRRFEWVVLIDVGLIGLMGCISIVSENEIFFKTKPAIVEGLAIVFFAVLILTPDRFLQNYLGRVLQGRALNDVALKMMKKMLGVLCVSILIHIGAVLYTAWYSSKEIWATVSGPGFYLTALPAVGMILIQRRRQRRHRQGGS